VDALNAIRQSVQSSQEIDETFTTTTTVTETTTLPCDWIIPDPPDGEEFDKDQVNVVFSSDGQEQQIGRVESLAECATVGGGWHYDDPEEPTTIHACPETCNVLETLTTATVDVLFGCATEISVPH
jgi:hypothetical protein